MKKQNDAKLFESKINLPFSFLLSQRYEGRGCCFDRIIETYIFNIDRLKNETVVLCYIAAVWMFKQFICLREEVVCNPLEIETCRMK